MKKIFAPFIGMLVAITAAYFFAPPPQRAAAQFVDQSTYGGNSGGSANAQTITIANYTSHAAGVVLRFTPGFTNTGPAQINISGLGLISLSRPSSIGVTGLSGGEIQSGELTCVVYNGSTYQLCYNVDMTPIGRTVEYRGAATPRGTLIEDGSTVSRTTFASLFSVIGTTYGAGDGSTTFTLPDSRGTMFAALDNQGANGAANRITSGGSGCTATTVGLCGTQSQTLTVANIAPFTPSGTIAITQNAITGADTFSGGGFAGGKALAATITATFTGNSLGSNTPHAILNPVLLGRRAIKY